MRRRQVEILYFESCPNHEAARAMVERIAAELQIEAELDLVEVPDGDAARRLRFLGSPTVRVDGRDVEPGAEERDDFVLACRVYRVEHGFSGQPDPTWIREALSQASGMAGPPGPMGQRRGRSDV